VKAVLLEEWEADKKDEEWYYYIEKMDFKKFFKFVENGKTVSEYMGDSESIADYTDGMYVFGDLETYERFTDQSEKCISKPDYDF
tara:strand:+ start:312 stop:566 length:255 start_codon:yes stop_codon:yes gene_type:complete